MASPSKFLDTAQALSPGLRGLYRPLQGATESLLGVQRLNFLFDACHRPGQASEALAEAGLKALGVDWHLDEERVQALRDIQGPLMIVANHPFGCIEALWLFIFLSRLGRDYRVMANSLLLRFESLAPKIIPVNPFGGSAAARQNLGPLKQSLAWLKSGGILALFPAGEVSSFDWRAGAVLERPWSAHAGRMALATNASVLPLHFEGQNSTSFHAAGLLHPRLRTALLLREAVYPPVKELKVKLGPLLDPADCRNLAPEAELSMSLRKLTMELA
jgi:putative hemolysin